MVAIRPRYQYVACISRRSAEYIQDESSQASPRSRLRRAAPQAFALDHFETGKTTRIRLSQMQDIGGCRAVLRTSDNAYDLASDFVISRIRHELVRHKNYIEYPRQSGYRSIHLVYEYNSDRSTHWQGLKTEIQIRSLLQHQWATAVETVGTFTRERTQVESRQCDLATLLRTHEYGDRTA